MKRLLAVTLSLLLLLSLLAACSSKPEIKYNDDGSWSEIERDRKGNPVKTSLYDAEGVLLGYEIREFDDEGWTIKYTEYDAKGRPID